MDNETKENLQRSGWGYSDIDYERLPSRIGIRFVKGHNVMEVCATKDGCVYEKSARLNEVNGFLHDANKRIAELEADKERLKLEVKDFYNKLNKSELDNRQLKAENERLQAEVTKLKASLDKHVSMLPN